MSIDLLELQSVGQRYGLSYGITTNIILTNVNIFTDDPDSSNFYTDVDLKNLEISSNVIATLQDAVGSTNSGNFASYCWIVKTTPIESVDGVIRLRIFFADNPRSYMTNDDNFMNISIFYK